MTFQIRTVGDPLELLSSIRVAVHQSDPLVVPSDVGTLAHRLDNVMATENMFARLSTLFGAVALLLTSIGLFGMLSYGVARRTKEFGVRLAMGARPSYVMRLVLQDGMTLVVIGIAIGIGGALVSVRYIAGHLFGLVPNNPFVIAGAAITVMAIAIVASLTPARRASRVVPVDALRYE
jgi:ABC-type antimicrobial peptide transport system permease subunit